MKHEIHVSDIRSFLNCRRKWDWSSPIRQNLERKVTYAPFFTGKAVHYGLQQLYDVGEHPVDAASRYIGEEVKAWPNQLWDIERAMVEEQSDLALGILDHYVGWRKTFKGPYSDSNLRFLATESSFSVPLLNDSGRKSNRVFLAGRFDGVVQRLDDESYWIFETKTAASIKTLADTLWNDMQCGTYILAAEQLYGVHISGVLYNILRKKLPTQPQILQDGTLSQRANIDSTAEAYFAFAVQHHTAPDSPYPMTVEEVRNYYRSHLQMLLDKGNTFFARVPIVRTPNEMAQLATDLWRIALEMTRSTTPIYPNPSFINCQRCPFRAPCLAMNNGGDVEQIMDAEYQVRVKWDPMAVEEEVTSYEQPKPDQRS